MVGPGRVGKAEVAVVRQPGTMAPDTARGQGGGGQGREGEPAGALKNQLQLAIMSMSLPVGVLAKHVLNGWVDKTEVAGQEDI